MHYDQTLARVETYFDKTATKTWEALTSDAPVSKVRETVRAGRDKMRTLMLSRLPVDLTGQRVLDAGCGAGQMTAELAKRGAKVVAVDISPSLVEIAQKRLPEEFQHQVTFASGDMLSNDLGLFDHVVAMDSLIYYTADEIGAALATLDKRTGRNIVFTVAPRTRALMVMWYAGKLFPRADRSPTMVPHSTPPLIQAAKTNGIKRPLRPVDTVKSGFYFSQAMELRG